MRINDRIKGLERRASPNADWDRLAERILPERRAVTLRAEIAVMEASAEPDVAALAELRAALALAEADALL